MDISSYFASLKWPDTVQDAVDLATKTIVAAVAAVIGFGYHYYQQQQLDVAERRASAEAKLQRELAAIREQREDARATYGFLVNGMPDTFTSVGAVTRLRIMIGYCNDPVNARAAIVATACKNLPAEPGNTPASGEALTKAASTPGYANSAEAQRANLSTAAVEASSAPALDAQWFTVVGTVPLTDPSAAKVLTKTLNAELRKAGIADSVQLWRTKISHSFALTVGGPRQPAEATGMASRVRSSGVVTDAFAQPNRNWIRDNTIVGS